MWCDIHGRQPFKCPACLRKYEFQQFDRQITDLKQQLATGSPPPSPNNGDLQGINIEEVKRLRARVQEQRAHITALENKIKAREIVAGMMSIPEREIEILRGLGEEHAHLEEMARETLWYNRTGDVDKFYESVLRLCRRLTGESTG
ncbi:MAG TPA: hypothetical protein VEI97_18665 [bacterium]|nr:hypothetical protein [bacterium]